MDLAVILLSPFVVSLTCIFGNSNQPPPTLKVAYNLEISNKMHRSEDLCILGISCRDCLWNLAKTASFCKHVTC